MGDRTFSVEFAALDYWAPEQARYRHKLDGVDADWVDTGSGRRFITYTGLRPGTYTLHVLAASRDGSWSGPERTLAITISPYLWERSWFLFMVVALFGAVAVGLLQINGYNARLRQQWLQEQVTLRTHDLATRSAQLEAEVAERTRAEIAARRAEADAQQSRDELAMQLAVSQHIAGTLDLDPLLKCILQELEQIERFDAAAIITREGDDWILRVVRSAFITRTVEGVRVDLSRSQTLRTILETRQPLIAADRAANPKELDYLISIFGNTDILHASLGIPLVAKDHVIGILTLFSHEAGYYRPAVLTRMQLFANQAALAIENARLYLTAQEAAALAERHRLARDLHDAVTQSLFSASLIAEALSDDPKRSSAKFRSGLDELRRLTRGALAEMRTLLLELRPAGLSEKPLGQLLRSLCGAFGNSTQIPVQLTVTEADMLPPQVQAMLYRIAQEALNNVSKHAAASAVSVRLTSSPEQVVLVVADDGRGFDLSNGAVGVVGASMRARAARIGAMLRIDSQPGEGTTVTVEWCPQVAQPAAQKD